MGICLSLLGCCSKDDGHHFKTGMMAIIGIKWESTAGGRAVFITFGAILSRIVMSQCCLTQTLRNQIYQENMDIMSLNIFSQISVKFTTSKQENGYPNIYIFSHLCM